MTNAPRQQEIASLLWNYDAAQLMPLFSEAECPPRLVAQMKRPLVGVVLTCAMD
jgi:hypothetical protein